MNINGGMKVEYLKKNSIVTVELKTGEIIESRFEGTHQLCEFSPVFVVLSNLKNKEIVQYTPFTEIKNITFKRSSKDKPWKERINTARKYFQKIGHEDSFWIPIIDAGYNENDYETISNKEHQDLIMNDFKISIDKFEPESK